MFSPICAVTDKATPRRMTSNKQEIDRLKGDIQQTKQDLASAEDLAQVDFHRKQLLYLESQLSSLREQQTILLRSNQHRLSSPLATGIGPLSDTQADQPPVLAATAQAANQVVESLQANGFAWLNPYKSMDLHG